MRPTEVFLAFAAALVLLASGMPAAVAQTEGEDRVLSGLRLSGDQPIQIESDKLEVREQENVAVFTGNVTVTQGTTVLHTRITPNPDNGAVLGVAGVTRADASGNLARVALNIHMEGDRFTASGGTVVDKITLPVGFPGGF